MSGPVRSIQSTSLLRRESTVHVQGSGSKIQQDLGSYLAPQLPAATTSPPLPTTRCHQPCLPYLTYPYLPTYLTLFFFFLPCLFYHRFSTGVRRLFLHHHHLHNHRRTTTTTTTHFAFRPWRIAPLPLLRFDFRYSSSIERLNSTTKSRHLSTVLRLR